MEYKMNFRCFYDEGNHTDHRRTLRLDEIGKWIDAYIYTHPEVTAITVKVYISTDQQQPPA